MRTVSCKPSAAQRRAIEPADFRGQERTFQVPGKNFQRGHCLVACTPADADVQWPTRLSQQTHGGRPVSPTCSAAVSLLPVCSQPHTALAARLSSKRRYGGGASSIERGTRTKKDARTSSDVATVAFAIPDGYEIGHNGFLARGRPERTLYSVQCLHPSSEPPMTRCHFPMLRGRRLSTLRHRSEKRRGPQPSDGVQVGSRSWLGVATGYISVRQSR